MNPEGAAAFFKPVRTALVLSGGGANGAVEVGFYKAIHEAGIKLDLVVGASVGAINGAMIACGLTPDEMHRHWRETRQQDFLKFNWRTLWRGMKARSLFQEGQMRRFLERGIPARRFEELRIPFVAVATDLVTGDSVRIEAGDLIQAVQASTALPAIFPPVWIGGRQLADGGIMRLVPVDVAIERGAETAIVGLSECRSDVREPVFNLLEALNRSFSLAVSRVARQPGYFERFAEKTNLVLLEPCFTIRISARHTFDLENTDIMVKFGYEYAKLRLKQSLGVRD